MQGRWMTRLFFAVVAALAVAGIVSGTACTRWGHPGAVPPTITPLSSIYVDAHTGSDTTGNGSMTKPYKTLTKAVEVLVASKSVSPSGVTITMASGDYNVANGEKFPIVIPKNVTITGSNFASGLAGGSFVDGLGEDTLFEEIAHAPPHTAYTTLEIEPPASVSVSSIYVGATKIKLPSSRAGYASLDVLATLSASTSAFGAGIVSPLKNVGGVLVPGGSLTCSSCQIRGNDFGISGLSVTVPTPPSSSPPTGPTITLMHDISDSTIAAKVVGILTDGSVNVSASGETFEAGQYAFADALKPIVFIPVRGAVDFGGGVTGSGGGNGFIGARTTEIYVTRRYTTISALDDVWNANQQGANRFGRYPFKHPFAAGATGKNVTILKDALSSTVTVGPAPVPTPTPSITPSISPSPSPT
jgi:hypothetical protein